MGDILSKTQIQNGLNRSKTFTLNQISELSTAVAQDIAILASAVDGISGGANSGLDSVVIENINNFFSPKDEFKDRYAEAPFGEENIFGLDLSNLIDGENFELDTENLTDEQVTRIRSGSASYNVANGISRGYVEVKTLCKCTVTVTYSISSQGSYDYGGCIVTEDSPNTEFTYANLKAANFFKNAGKSLNQTVTYNLDADKTYYLNFGYAKNASTNSNDDRFYIHSIRVVPENYYSCSADCFFIVASETKAAHTTLTSAYDTLNTAANKIANSLGGVFSPAVSGRSTVDSHAAANLPYIENKLTKVFAGSDWSIPKFDAVTLCGDVVVSIHGDSGSPEKWSLVGSEEQFVTLVSDTTSVQNTYKICPLSDSGGFIYRSAYNTVGYAAGVSIQPFVITSAGKPSLGSATSILGSQNSVDYANQHVYMARSIYDPTHIIFYCTQESSVYDIQFKYTSIAFQGNTNTYTRTKTLTTLGTWHAQVSANSTDSCCLIDTYMKSISFRKLGIQSKVDFTRSSSTSDYSTTFQCVTPLARLKATYWDSSWTPTSDKYPVLIHHGLYRAAPVLLTLTDNPFPYGVLGVWGSRRSSSAKATCYIVTWKTKNTTVEHSTTWFDSLFKICIFDATSNRICETSWTLSEVINDFLL